jgi:hypothetical protein
MSKLAVKLFEEREEKKENYLPLIQAIFAESEYDSTLNENKEFTTAVQEVLCQLNESNPFGALQRYFVEEYFLHGKSKEEIGKEIAANMELLLSDLENTAIRFLHHPERAKPLQPHIKK